MKVSLNYLTKTRAFYKAFTLIEILLVLILIISLFSVLIINLTNSNKKEYLYEGTLHTQTILRIVKCKSEITGRRFCIKFPKIIGGDDEELLGEKYKDMDIIIEWEPNPIEYPEVFVNFEQLNENCKNITELIDFVDIKSQDQENGMIMFYPDGSSDSVNITISSKFEEDNNKKNINVNGVTGLISITSKKDYSEDSTVHF